MNRSFVLFAVLLSLLNALIPGVAWSCACGCGVFEVGTAAMLPTHPGGMAFLEYDSLNQNKNWTGSSRGSDDDNSDKQLRTNFFTVGVQYMLDRKWGFMVEVPYWNRMFKTADDSGNIGRFNSSAVGDIRVRGLYTGFSADMSTGLAFGLKLPSGDYYAPGFDRDSQIGTGSTDLLFGGFHVGSLFGSAAWNWFANGQIQQPTLISGGYRPGAELDVAVGAYYHRWNLDGLKLSPLGQLVASRRLRDSGILANSPNSGYERLIVSPGFEVDASSVRFYADVGFPVYQFVNGNQLVASPLYKLNVGYAF